MRYNLDKISIIIPVYNVEPYLKRCLDSIINQTYTNLEILCIDDGSTDNSGKICDEYSENDGRIVVFHKCNGGLSSALNVGLKSFTGKYVGFTDSDDWIEPDMYEVLHGALRGGGPEMSIVGYFTDTDMKSVAMTNKTPIVDGVIPQKDMLLYPLKRDYYMGYCGYVWNKLYPADIILNNGLRFDENIRYGMDILFYYNAVLKGNPSGVYIDKPVYHYCQRSTAITKTSSLDLKSDILKVYKAVSELLNDYGHEDISYWARGFYCYHASVIAEMALKKGDTIVLSRMQDEIREYLDDYLETNWEFPEKFNRMYALLNTDRSVRMK